MIIQISINLCLKTIKIKKFETGKANAFPVSFFIEKHSALCYTYFEVWGIDCGVINGGIFMEFLIKLLEIMDAKMEEPKMYGIFHLSFFVLSVVLGIVLCRVYKKPDTRFIRRLMLIVSGMVMLLEIYKQINYSFSYTNGIKFDYQWYAFPFQFCSTPMYIGLLAGITKKGKLHDALCAYLATFSTFAGFCVMFYPAQVFVDTIGINIQTMLCHGAMITVGIYLLGSGYVKAEYKTILKATSVFACLVATAAVMNEIAYCTGLLETETFNMFFISPHCEPSLPVYSLVQAVVPFPWCTLIYIVAFSLAAYIILLISMLPLWHKNSKTVYIGEINNTEEIKEEITV